MKLKFKAPLETVVAMSVGLIVLLGYFTSLEQLQNLRAVFLQWALILSAVALLVGVTNLLRVHWRKIQTRAATYPYSVFLILALVLTFALGAYDYLSGTLGKDNQSWLLWIFTYIQLPVESSLMAMLAISFVYALARVLRWRINLFSFLFLLTALLMIASAAPLMGFSIPFLSESLRPWIAQIPAAAGARGILLGVALGTIATGLRLLIGADRPYGG
ncbi:MAG: hypothetical protein OHK0052_27980 [Anaerolineales bacterium]